MGFDKDKFTAQAIEISQDLVPNPGMRSYCVMVSYTFAASNGGTAVGGWTGTMRFPKRFTAYQRYIETLVVIDGIKVADTVMTAEDGLPGNMLITFFSCVPDHTFAQHYRKAFVRDLGLIWNWLIRSLGRKQSEVKGDGSDQAV